MSELLEVNSELKVEDCPFCGASQIREGNGKVTIGKEGKMLYVFCHQCSTYGPVALAIDEAIEYWNERPLEDVLQKRIDELIQSVGIMATFKPTMEMNINKPVDMALEVSNYIVGLNQRISALEAECDALKEVQTWIPIRLTERFVPEDVPVEVRYGRDGRATHYRKPPEVKHE
jgi:hypothetical protein